MQGSVQACSTTSTADALLLGFASLPSTRSRPWREDATEYSRPHSSKQAVCCWHMPRASLPVCDVGAAFAGIQATNTCSTVQLTWHIVKLYFTHGLVENCEYFLKNVLDSSRCLHDQVQQACLLGLLRMLLGCNPSVGDADSSDRIILRCIAGTQLEDNCVQLANRFVACVVHLTGATGFESWFVNSRNII